jgi:hypothetical protein
MAEAKEVSKKELAEAYAKLKARGKATQDTARKQGEELIRDAITVASGGALGYYMGMMEGDADLSKATNEDEEAEAIAENQQVAGIDLDLLIGGGAALAGLTKMGGKMSDTLRAIGVGGLTEWAGRTAYESGVESATEEEEP